MAEGGKIKMRVAIVGPGAVGKFLSMKLVRADGVDVVRIGKEDSPEKISAELDFVFIAVKQPDFSAAIRKLYPLIGSNALIIPLQNGIEHYEILEGRFGKNAVAGTIGGLEVYKSGKKLVWKRSGNEHINLASRDNTARRRLSRELQPILNSTGIKTNVGDDPKKILWEKLVRMCAIGGVCAASGLPIGKVLQDNEWRNSLVKALKAATEIAKVDGTFVSVSDALSAILALSPKFEPSLLKDLKRKKPNELDAILGAVVRRGEKLGVCAGPIAELILKIKKKYKLK